MLPNDSSGRSSFVSSGGLAKVLSLPTEDGSETRESVDIISSCYPDEIVRFYSPGYSDTLMEKIDNYSLPGGN
mgnify:CR=1 FL=1